MSHAAAAAARVFERTLEELERQESSLDLGDPATLGRRRRSPTSFLRF